MTPGATHQQLPCGVLLLHLLHVAVVWAATAADVIIIIII